MKSLKAVILWILKRAFFYGMTAVYLATELFLAALATVMDYYIAVGRDIKKLE